MLKNQDKVSSNHHRHHCCEKATDTVDFLILCTENIQTIVKKIVVILYTI